MELAHGKKTLVIAGSSEVLGLALDNHFRHVVHTLLDGLILSDKTQQRFAAAQQAHSMAPADLAEVYLQVFHQAQSTWTQGLDLRPMSASV